MTWCCPPDTSGWWNDHGVDIAGKAHRLMTIPKTVFGLSAGVVLLALTGCGSKPDAWCTVTDDLRAIAEAREMADRVQEQEIATLLAHLADPLLDIDAFAVLRGAQDIPWLTSLLASEVSDYTKCRVMLALDRGDGGQGGRLLAALDDPKNR